MPEAEPKPSRKRVMHNWNEYEGPLMTTQVGALIIAHYNSFSQDKASLAQVGDIPNEFEFRAARLVVRGQLGTARRISYFYAGVWVQTGSQRTNGALKSTMVKASWIGSD